MSFMLKGYISLPLPGVIQNISFALNGQLILVNGELKHNTSIGNPTTRKVIQESKPALGEFLTPAVAVDSAILPVTDVFSTRYS